jgi:hypothetical protein
MPKNTAEQAESDDDRSQALIDEMENAHDDVELNNDSLVFDLRDALLEVVKRMPQPWGQTPEAGQRDIAAALEHAADAVVAKAVDLIRANGAESIRALLVSYAEKGGDVTASLKIKPYTVEDSENAILSLHRASGKHVLITVASAADFKRERTDPKTDPDAPPLDFEAGSDLADDAD